MMSSTIRLNLRKCLIFIFIAKVTALQSQTIYESGNLRFQQFQAEAGLPHGNVNCIIQDQKGYIWFGTENGLVRYDGYEFYVFHEDPNDPHSISGENIGDIFEDRDGYIWIGTAENGLNRYDPQTEKFINLRYDPDNPNSISSNNFNHFRVITQDKTGAICLALWKEGFNRLRIFEDPQTGKDSIKVLRYAPANLPQSFFSFIDSLQKSGQLIAEMNNFGIGEKRSGTLTLEEDELVLIGSVFDRNTFFSGYPDNAWIENISGDTIWQLKDKYTYDGNGFFPGYFQIGVETFSTGEYTINYQAAPKRPIWMGGEIPPEYGLFLISINDDEAAVIKSILEENPRSAGMVESTIRSVFADDAGTVWLAGNGGLSRLHIPDSSLQDVVYFEHFQPQWNNSTSFQSLISQSITPSTKGGIWFGGRGLNKEGKVLDFNNDPGLYVHYFDPGNNSFMTTTSPSTNSVIYSQLEDRNGTLWLGTYLDGLIAIPKANQQMNDGGFTTFHKYKFSGDKRYGGNRIFSICEDRSGSLWFGTWLTGLIKFTPSLNIFHFNKLPYQSEEATNITCILEDRTGYIWVGTDGNGLFKYDPTLNNYYHYQSDSEVETSLASPSINNLLETQDGKIFVLGPSGLHRYLPEKNRFRRYPFGKMAMAEDDRGYLWVGDTGENFNNSRGIYRLDLMTDSVKVFPSCNQFSTLYPDSRGNIWIGCRFSLSNLTLNVKNNAPDKTVLKNLELPVSSYLDIEEDNQGQLWLATLNRGLIRFNPDTEESKRYRVEDGLPHETIYDILIDDSGYFWLITLNGLSRFDPDKEIFKNFGKENGIELSNIVLKKGIKTRNGELLIPGIRGYYRFHPDSIKINKIKPQVHITGVFLEDRNDDLTAGISEIPINTFEEISLNYKENDLVFNFIALHFDRPSQNQYAYKLEGVNDNWIYIGDQREARFADLSPGSYIFRVKAANADRIWNEEGAFIKLRILPPWWETNLAKVFYGIVSIGFLFFLRYWELRKQKLKLEQQKRINLATSKFVPQAFLKSIGRKDIMEVELGDQVEREVTVLFLDIRNYSTMAEKMTPSQNFKFVNSFNQRIGPIIQQSNGFVLQFLGDGFMALFMDTSGDALRAAINIQRELDIINIERSQNDQENLRVGIGIHTGPLIMGIIGDDRRYDAAIISDTVNTASRIEGLTKYYKTPIILSEESKHILQKESIFHFRYLGKFQLKGKNEPVGLYECYDSDSTDLFNKKVKTQLKFELGLNQFFNREFDDSIETFKNILKIIPDDMPTQIYFKKSITCAETGVTDDWNGVEMMTFK